MKRPLILLAEDDPFDADAAKIAIELAGCDALICKSGEEVLRQLESRNGSPKCVITDLGMPGIGGLGLLRELKAIGHRVPAIVLTNSNFPGDIQKAYATGAIWYFEKPVDFKELNKLIADFLGLLLSPRSKLRP